MKLCEFVTFHSGINNKHSLFLYEATLLGKWLRTFRQTVSVSLSKGQTSKTILSVQSITTIWIPDDVTGNIHSYKSSGRNMTFSLTQPLIEMNTKNLSLGVKCGWFLGLIR
jgi:hypothetical protein